MKTFNITIEEVVSETFKIEANSMEEAMEIAEEKYNNCEVVLEPGNLVSKSMQCEDLETNETTDWVDF